MKEKIERIILQKSKYPDKNFMPKEKVKGYEHATDGVQHDYKRGKITFIVDNTETTCSIEKFDTSKGVNIPLAKSDFYKFINIIDVIE